MGNPTDKPKFEDVLVKIIGLHVCGRYSDAVKELSSLYEQGYHVGVIYGWGIEQDNDRLRSQDVIDRYTTADEPDPFEPL